MLRLLPLALIALLGLAPGASAQQLVYEPLNPAFGGSYLNYSWLLQSATTQNDFEADQTSRFFRDPLQDFQSSLQRQILSQLSRELIGNRFGDLDLSQPGTFELGEFNVEVIPGLGGVTIRVFNLLTGEETVVTIPNP